MSAREYSPIVEAFKNKDMTTKEFIDGHFYKPMDQAILDRLADEHRIRKEQAIEQAIDEEKA